MIIHFLKDWSVYKINDVVSIEEFYVNNDYDRDLLNVLQEQNVLEVIDETTLF